MAPEDAYELIPLASQISQLFVPMATNSSSGKLSGADVEVIVAIVPFPKYSHLSQLFKLARFIASHNIRVHFLSHANRNHDLKLRLQDAALISTNIHFNDLMVTEEDDDAAGKYGLPPVALLVKKLSEPIRGTCLQLSAAAKRRLVIIYESTVRDSIGDHVLSLPNVEPYVYNPISAFASYSLLRELMMTRPTTDRLLQFNDDDHEKMHREMQDDFPTVESCFGPYVALMSDKMECESKLNAGELIYSFREMEGKYLDLLSKGTDNKKPTWAIGPVHHMLLDQSRVHNHHECLEFLDKQGDNSVILVSFGTTTAFSQEQLNELALGLERSNHRFIWVLRKADDDKIRKSSDGKKDGEDIIELPQGFEERVDGRGMVVRNWLPQLEILGHPSIGGFLSHCGWSSCIDSIINGVPLAAWPLRFDMPYNAVLITNALKIGIPVMSWAHRHELVTAPAIEKAVKTLMGTPEGEEIRQRAVELSNQIKSSAGRKEMESFISHIIK